MAEIEELSHKIHVLIAQHEQLYAENEKLKDENKKLVYENKELICELEKAHDQNQMLKCELEAMYEKLRMMEMQSMCVSQSMDDRDLKCSRIRPYDADEETSEDRERKKGGKKTSL